MLDKDEPTLGTADRVTSANRNHLIHYAGNAVVWQTSNRIQADRIDIDRDKKSIIADGQVITQFEDKPKPDAPPVEIRAAHLHHRESRRTWCTRMRTGWRITPAASTSGGPR